MSAFRERREGLWFVSGGSRGEQEQLSHWRLCSALDPVRQFESPVPTVLPASCEAFKTDRGRVK